MDYRELISTLTVVAPIPPQGFLGTKGLEVEPCYPDYAGSGAGRVDEGYRDRRKQSDRTRGDPSSPRHELTEVYCDPDVELDPEREEVFLESSPHNR